MEANEILGPYDCLICGNFFEECICPKCQICGDYGNPFCYEHHGLEKTDQQRESLYQAEEKYRAKRNPIKEDTKQWRPF